jgi:hypothetical protein
VEESSGRIGQTGEIIHGDDDSRLTVCHDRADAWHRGRHDWHTRQPSLYEDTRHTLAGWQAWKDQEIGFTE